MKTFKQTLLCVNFITCLLTLSGCNTVRGIGQDIEKLGSTIEGAAKK